MALKKLLWTVPETPYSKPPPIHLSVVAKAVELTPQLGEHLRLTHLKLKVSGYGVQLHSTTYTKLEEVKASADSVTVVGVTEEQPGMSTLLTKEGNMVRVEHGLWEPFDARLRTGKICVSLTREGRKVTKISAVEDK
ncbi:uncharacterized protein AKAME5_002927500 [Lates japonicus]|uniref:Uncharacterized protein n=1 Tax=Lates japonicus TaxID=270547 RepID=A0AAD3N477_LATJO|nr:uncharacterized protein AKAME5_002927500 [Lates japonicus]